MQTLLTHSLLSHPIKQWNPKPGASRYWVFKLKLRAYVKGAVSTWFSTIQIHKEIKIKSRINVYMIYKTILIPSYCFTPETK